MLPILIEKRQHDADILSMYNRILDLKGALKKKSHFLLGPRATGKSWLIRKQIPEAQIFDLLNGDTYSRLLRRPHSLAEEIQSNLVVIDEVQKLPQLLDEVHRLIEERKIHFLLTGSSARKLRRGGANLLAGRARTLHMYPLAWKELNDFDLVKYCNYGGLPLIWQSDDYWRDLREYTQAYLREEIIAEAVVRKVDHYARFLDVIGLRSGEELNYQQIASDSGVPPRTVDNFVEILKDTLLAFELEPFKTKKRKAVAKSKIYLFDVGVANYLAGRKNLLERSDAFGKAFEHFIIQEIRAYLGYQFSDLPMQYWRTQGPTQYEVDCVLGDQAAIEIKASDKFSERAIAGLKALQEENKIDKFYLISRDPVARQFSGVHVLHYQDFLNRLWAGDIVKP